jgi:hypothetical protein
MYRDQMRFYIEMQRRLVWDEVCWAVDDRGQPSQLMKEMPRELDRQARALGETRGDRAEYFNFGEGAGSATLFVELFERRH